MHTTTMNKPADLLFGDGANLGANLIESESAQDAIFYLTAEGQLNYRHGREYLPKGALPVAVLTVQGDQPTVIFLGGTGQNDREPLVNLVKLKNLIGEVEEELQVLPERVRITKNWLRKFCQDRVTREMVDGLYWEYALEFRKLIEAQYGTEPHGRLVASLEYVDDSEESFPLNENARTGSHWHWAAPRRLTA